MTHEKTLKREDGTRVKIIVAAIYRYTDCLDWQFQVFTKAKGKRKWQPALDAQSYGYRKLPLADRRAVYAQACLKVVTKEELVEAMQEYWHQLRPTIEDIPTTKG